MLRTNVYLTEEQEQEIKTRANDTQRAKAVVLREIIETGIKATNLQKSASTEVYMKLANIADQFKGKGTAPKDLAANLDKYTWDE